MLYSHLFGPVRSRRLGRSLGVDLVPHRICTFNCVYCECGTIPSMTCVRKDFFPVAEVLSELSDCLSRAPTLDFITFSGSGEPTLSLSIGTVIRYLKEEFPAYRVAVLTNGSLLYDPAVRRDLLDADVVLPTLSSVYRETFRKIHRPEPSLSLPDIIAGLQKFRAEYAGEIWLEVFIVPGLNMSGHEVTGLRNCIRKIRPDRVQLNTLDRPGTEGWVRSASRAELEKVRQLLDWPGTEILAVQERDPRVL